MIKYNVPITSLHHREIIDVLSVVTIIVLFIFWSVQQLPVLPYDLLPVHVVTGNMHGFYKGAMLPISPMLLPTL